jgi:large subunit ribosomal protein L28
MAHCEICGKHLGFGNNVSHAKNRTKRHWLPNIHAATFYRDGVAVKVKACTRCIRTQYKAPRVR